MLHVSKVPELLFDELSLAHGVGPEPVWYGSEGYHQYKDRELRNGLGGIVFVRSPQIGYTVIRYFAEWPIQDHAFGYQVEVIAQQKDAGLWVARQGSLIQEVVEVIFPSRGLNLQKLPTQYCLYIFARAAALCQDPDLFSLRFWEADRDARSTFDSPPE